MLISIIIPAYNAQRYLRQTLQFVLSQTGGRLEILVVNDGSTDDTGRIAEDYARRYSRIRVIHTENRGVSHARNVGILPSTAMRLSRTALLRPVYFRMKYRMPMGSFLSRGLGRPIPAI